MHGNRDVTNERNCGNYSYNWNRPGELKRSTFWQRVLRGIRILSDRDVKDFCGCGYGILV